MDRSVVRWRARSIVQLHGARRASRPQLKRDPLGRTDHDTKDRTLKVQRLAGGGGWVASRDRELRRSEERRVGEEGRSRGAPYPLKKKKNQQVMPPHVTPSTAQRRESRTLQERRRAADGHRKRPQRPPYAHEQHQRASPLHDRPRRAR